MLNNLNKGRKQNAFVIRSEMTTILMTEKNTKEKSLFSKMKNLLTTPEEIKKAEALEAQLGNRPSLHNPFHDVQRGRGMAEVEKEELPVLDVIAKDGRLAYLFAVRTRVEKVEKAHAVKLNGKFEMIVSMKGEAIISDNPKNRAIAMQMVSQLKAAIEAKALSKRD